MTKALGTLLIAVSATFGQIEPGAATIHTGTVTGLVRETATGAPIADAMVVIGQNSRTGQNGKTDAQGRYSISNVPAGQHRVAATAPRRSERGFPPYATRIVNLAPGQEVASVNIALDMPAQLSGKVVDQNKEPMVGVSVLLVAREYSLGMLRHVFASVATTNDGGEYVLAGVRPGRAYLLMAQKRTFKLDAISDAPADPKLRKPAVVATYYPGTSDMEGAQPLFIRPGERREGVDLRVLRSPSYCIEGVVHGAAGPQVLAFTIADRQPTSGASGDGAMFMASPGGVTGPDGKIRICNLYPGNYQLTAYNRDEGMPQFYGSADTTIVDRDVPNLTLVARPHVAISGEVVWDGEPPDPPLTDKISVVMRPMTRAPWREELSDTKSSIPGTFSFPSVLTDSYSVQLNGVPKEVYVKEVTYAGQNLRAEPLRVGGGIGETTLRVVLARDGGTVAARVADKDGNAVPDARVLILPITVASETALAAAIVSGQCDQNGAWTSNRLAPGKYYVVALYTPYNNSPESIGKLWGSRTHFKEIELAPKGNVQVALGPMSLD